MASGATLHSCSARSGRAPIPRPRADAPRLGGAHRARRWRNAARTISPFATEPEPHMPSADKDLLPMQSILDHLHPSNWSFLWDALSKLAMSLAAAAAILWFGWWFSRRVAGWISRRGASIDPTLRPIVRDTAVWGVRVVAVVGAL